jgi:uncharacterized protein (TIGR02391 family)
MARSSNPQSPSKVRFTEPKQFSSIKEIDAALKKLHKRIDEVQSLRNDQVPYSDRKVTNAEQNIKNSILEIFGPNSPEYGHILQDWYAIFLPTHQVILSDYEEQSLRSENQQRFQEKLPQTITMLEGFIQQLKEKRSEIGDDPKVRAKTVFDQMELHSRIANVCTELYHDGHYRQAVLDGSIALENYVREKSRRHDLTGANLMRTVFSAKDPILAFNHLYDQTDKDEQEGMMHLFEGAVLALRNPRAHDLSDDSPELAFDYIALLSLLAKRLDNAERK